jgi:hypothetical protein
MKKAHGENMMKESSTTMVMQGDKVLKDGFHDEFDALEWLTSNFEAGNYTIRTDRKIIL